jgi:hypothetical protein
MAVESGILQCPPRGIDLDFDIEIAYSHSARYFSPLSRDFTK